MPTFNVPVVIEINGSIEVEADSPEEAINVAKDEYDRRRAKFKKNESIGGLAVKLIDCPDVQVDFAHGEAVTLSEVVVEGKAPKKQAKVTKAKRWECGAFEPLQSDAVQQVRRCEWR